MFVIKELLCAKNVKKLYDNQLRLALFSAFIARKNTGVYYISTLSCHTACQAQQRWKQDQKYKTKIKTKTKATRPNQDQVQKYKIKTKTEAGLRPVLS